MKISVFLLLVTWGLGCAHIPEPEMSRLVGRTQFHMGTSIEVRVPQDKLKVSEKAFQVFADLDKKLSTYKKNSEISRLNKGQSLRLSPETLEVLQLAETIKLRSGGYFDIQKGRGPDGPRDLGGIGKGFAVDKARQALQSVGIKRGLIAASGDIYCFHACEVAIRNPKDRNKSIALGRLKTGSWAITTSGRDWRDHIKNPDTGKHPRHWMSVTLISRSLSNAELDAWATGLFAMPEDKAFEVLQSLSKLDYFVITSSGKKQTSSRWTDRFYSPSAGGVAGEGTGKRSP